MTKIKINSLWLKIIALTFMIIDHIGHFFILPIMNNQTPVDLDIVNLYSTLRFMGRIAFPIFCFTFVEGFKYTSNKKKYGVRLLITALVMALGNILLSDLTWLSALSPNIFMTFFVMFLVLCCLERMGTLINQKKKLSPILWAGLGVLLCSMVCKHLEYGIFAVFTILCFYFIKDKFPKLLIYTIGSFILCLAEANVLQIGMCFATIFLALYTSEKPKHKVKWLFYVFYPAHIWLFAILEAIML